MKFTGLNRSTKTRILTKLLEGQTAPLASVRKPLSSDLSRWTDEELYTEYERLRQKQYRQTGVLPPPMPDFSAMSLEELQAYRDEKLNNDYESSPKDQPSYGFNHGKSYP